MGICLPYFHGLARVHLNSVLIVCPTQCLLRAYRSQALCWGWVQCCPTSCSLGQEMEIRLPHSRSFLLSLPQDHYGEDSNLGRMHVSSGSGWPGVNLSAQCCFSTAVEPQVSYLATPLSVLKWKWGNNIPPHRTFRGWKGEWSCHLGPTQYCKADEGALEHPSHFSYLLCPLSTSPLLSATNTVIDASQTRSASSHPFNLFALFSKNGWP